MFVEEVRNCPRCQEDMFEGQGFIEIPACPHCGYYDVYGKKKKPAPQESQKTLIMGVIASIMCLAFIHTGNFGKHSFSIVPLKAKQFTGAANEADLTKIATICSEVKSYSCATQAMFERAALVPKNLKYLLEYGTILDRTSNKQEAIKVYKLYLNNGGSDFEAKYRLGKALADTNQLAEASDYYRRVLQAKPRVFQITVSREYVELLMKKGDYKLAKKFIKKVRRTGENAPLFMEDELKIIESAKVVAMK